MWFSFDPQSNFDHLYVTTHKTKLLRKVDLANERVDILPQFSSGLDRPAIINWTVDENQDMILTDDRSEGSNVNAHFVFKRSTDFKNSEPLVNAKARSLTAAIVHPKNGELYYTAYYDQNIFRYDFETQQVTTPNRHFATKETIRMVVHPEGKYAYLMRYYHQNGGGYIARMDYDDNAKAFTDPYIICGTTGAGGYVDGVGDRAKVNKPAQGVFVKNPNYEGEEDEYDFYFCDEGNNCVRMMTPYGRITTFAGRGNGIATGDYADGELRTEARFNAPCAIAYDEKRKCFYVGDSGNNVIRKIALEE
jgi:DNA-binding beta-propeller fold protein YncE